MVTDALNHPAFQSLVLPLLLCLAGVAGLLRVAGPHRAALGGALGLLLALAVFPGFDWPATARVQKLPWTVLVGALVAAGWLFWRPARQQARTGRRGIALAAALTVAALALTAVAGTGGSLLIAQLALMVAVATAVPGLWAWWRPSSGLAVPALALLPQALAWLLLAATLALGAPGPASGNGTGATEDPYYAPRWK
jgi:hypothetical protein